MKSDDIRSVRTRLALRNALTSLVEKKPLSKITVTEIAAAAGVSIPTVYRHYRSVEDLVSAVANDQFANLGDQIVSLLRAETADVAAAIIAGYLADDTSFWRRAAGNDASSAARGALIARVADMISADGCQDATTVELIARLAVLGVLETLDWAAGQANQSIGQTTSVLLELVSNPLRQRLTSLSEPPAGEPEDYLRDSSNRRLRSKGEFRRTLLLDTAERLITEQGYAALTTRRLAHKASVMPSLVHYYFDTTDDLLLAVYKRADARAHQRTMRALASGRPLDAFWHVWGVASQTSLGTEFYALSNHWQKTKNEIVQTAIAHRKSEAQALAHALPHTSRDLGLDPEALILLLGGLSRMVSIEESIGVTIGHDALKALVGKFIAFLESGEMFTSPAGALSDGSVRPMWHAFQQDVRWRK